MMPRRTKDEMGTYFSTNQTFIRSESEGKILARIARTTGFEVGTEIYRGRVYDNKKVKDVVYDGTYNDQKAVLKVQGVRPAYEEADLIKAFERQNRSKIVRAPSVFYHESWNRSRGYGFTIMEFV